MEEVSAVLAKMHPELICPVCLDYLDNPITIDCSHNFCASCIRTSWKDLQDRFPCPVCRRALQEMRVSGNAQLGRLVDLVKLLHSSGSREMAQAEEHRCEEHRQVVSLFCEDYQEPVCPLCPQGPVHQGPNIRPGEEVAHQYRQRLGGFIESLKSQRATVEKLLVIQEKKLLQLREEVRMHNSQLASEFEQLTQFVEREQEAALCRLAKEDKRLQQQLRANLEAYWDHIWALKDLRREVAEWSVMSKEMVLMGVRGLQKRWAGLQSPVMQPLLFRPVAYSLPPLCSALSSIIWRFRERISMDPYMAHPSLRVFQDLMSVTCGFASGRHYWAVQVGAKPKWAVGVCSVAPSAQATGPLASPKRCWTLQLQDGDYLALGAGPVPLALRDQPAAIGVYLDWELGQLSFYNAADRSHLHSFTEPFAQELKPYFLLRPDCAPLSVGVGRV
ncbi:tripartite motif-containing protein 75-like [Sorex fumeus]|uniref:tripartite motif-containing protein 75-like n=1 Tax=Sorex fumeus TaxID=62283 RepID=UPI0024ADA428|nr:tripartite motif-containing protein 75-like [Sorex fumeus]